MTFPSSNTETGGAGGTETKKNAEKHNKFTTKMFFYDLIKKMSIRTLCFRSLIKQIQTFEILK